MSRVLVIPDLHCPAEHPDTWKFLKEINRIYTPDRIICLGDEIDAHMFSRYAKNPDLPGAGDELESSIQHLNHLYELFPRVDVCISNHTARPFRVAEAAGLPARLLPTYRKLLKAPRNYRWADQWSIDGVTYVHGDPFEGQGATARLLDFHRTSVVHGHVHAHAQTITRKHATGTLYGTNAGCLIDFTSPRFAYAKKVHRPWIGCAIVVNGTRHLLIPLE